MRIGDREVGRGATGHLMDVDSGSSPVDGSAPFRLQQGVGTSLRLAGELDLAGTAMFDRACARVLPSFAGKIVDIDCRRLSFVDHRALLVLEEHARRAGVKVILLEAPSTVPRLLELLALEHVHAGGDA